MTPNNPKVWHFSSLGIKLAKVRLTRLELTHLRFALHVGFSNYSQMILRHLNSHLCVSGSRAGREHGQGSAHRACRSHHDGFPAANPVKEQPTAPDRSQAANRTKPSPPHPVHDQCRSRRNRTLACVNQAANQNLELPTAPDRCQAANAYQEQPTTPAGREPELGTAHRT